MKGFIEYTDAITNLRGIVNVSTIVGIGERDDGKTNIFITPQFVKLKTVETYDEIRSRLDACIQEGNT